MKAAIHQDGVLKDASTYEIMRPEMVGLKQSSLVLGKHSGRHAFVHKLEEMGYSWRQPAGKKRIRADGRRSPTARRTSTMRTSSAGRPGIANAHDRIKLASLTVTRAPMARSAPP